MRLLLTLIAITIYAMGAKAQFQGLIVNEFSQGDQGSREYIELLVVGNRTCTDSTADLRGWIFDDQNGWYGTNSISPGHHRFANVSNWAAVPFGSIILFYNSAAGEKNLSINTVDDPTDANHDYNYILPINSNGFLDVNMAEPQTGSGPGYNYPLPSSVINYVGSSNTWGIALALNNGGDVISTVSPADRTTAYFSIGYNFTINPGYQTPVVSVANVSGGKNCYLSSASYNVASSWVTGNADPALGTINETPGAPNGGANSTWITSMRLQMTPEPPGVNVSQPDCNNPTGTITITSPFGLNYSYSKDGVNYNQFNTIFTQLAQGAYSITVKQNGCISLPTVVTINAAPSTPAIAVTTITQPDCNNPTATINVIFPLGAGLTYSINGTYQSSNVFTGVSPGNYGVTVKNATGCVSTASIITVDPAPQQVTAPSVTVTSQPDCSNPTGSISIGSPSGMSYSVDGINYSNTSGIFTNLVPGNYNVTARNSFGCVSPVTPVTINVPVQMPATPVLTIGQTSCTSSTGTIIINSPSGGGLQYSIDGINYSTQTVYNGLLPGNYYVSVQSPAGCITAPLSIIINPAPFVPSAPVVTTIQPTCTASTGSVTVNSPGGLHYSIDGIDYSNSSGVFFNLVTGSYNITAQGGNGCISPSTNVIINQQPVTPVASVNSPNVCPGSSATITATASPAVTYNYTWTVPPGETNPGNTASFNASTAGVYSVIVTNVSGCSTTSSGNLSINAVATVSADDKVVCQNATVQLSGQPSGGLWSGANVTGSFFNATGLTPGIYPVNYTLNSGGCSGMATANITVASLPATPVININQPDCFTATGNINIVSPTGTGYVYSIDATSYSGNPVFNNIIPGNYSVYIQNSSGCISSASAVVQSQPVIPTAPLAIATQPVCAGNSGAITIGNPSAGLLYSIDGINYQSATLFTGLTPGTYSVTSKLTGGCVSSSTVIVINNPSPLPPAPLLTVGQPGCSLPTGTVSITSPVSASFVYSVDGLNYQGSPNFVLLQPGNYPVTVKDNNGCVSQSTVAIINVAPSAPPSPVVTLVQPTCTSPWGSISVNSPIGSGFSYSIDGINFTGNSVFTNLAPASYSVSVQNSTGCISPATIAVINIAPVFPAAPGATVSHPSCLNPTGSITINSPNGNGLSYSIDGINYQSSPLFTNLTPGSYNLTVQNISGCISPVSNVLINPQPGAPVVPSVTVIQPTCVVPTGSLTVNSPSGPGLTFSVDGLNYFSLNVFNQLAPGNYSVLVKNAAGCISSATIVINQPPANFSATVTSNTAQLICPVPNSLVPTLTATTSVPGTYTYSWSVPAGAGNPGNVAGFTATSPGQYIVTVSNSAGCSNTASINLSVVSPVIPSFADDKQVCLNSAVGLTSQIPGGSWSGSYVNGSTFNASGVLPGTYPVYYLAVTNNYCIYSIAQVTVVPLPPSPVVSVSNHCNGTTTLTASGYTGSLLWSNNATVPSITVSTVGNYWVNQTVNGCTGPQAIATAAPALTQVLTQNISGCGGIIYNGNSYLTSVTVRDTVKSSSGCDSIIHVTNITVKQPSVSDTTVCKTAGQTYDFNGTLLNTSGHYNDTLLSASGCDSIVHLNLLIATTKTNTISGCGSVNYNGTSYTASTTLSQTILSVVTGCDSLILVTNIIVNPEPELSPMSNSIICRGDSVHITATTSGGTIEWQGFGSGNSIIVNPIVTTTYVAVATTAAGCSDTGSVTVTVKQFDVVLTASNNQAITGTSVSLQSSSLSTYQVLSWSPANLFSDQKAISQKLIVDSSVTCMLIAKSSEGCRDTAYATIVANPMDDIYIPTAFTPNGDGKNDVFRVLGGKIQSMDLKIFNRWGELIFRSTDRSKGWDGFYAGKEQASAVYIYSVTVVLHDGRKLVRKGTVTLIR